MMGLDSLLLANTAGRSDDKVRVADNPSQNTQPPDSVAMSESAGEVIRKINVQLFLLTKRWSSVYHHCHRG